MRPGGADNDTLIGGWGDDTLTGNAGRDRYIFLAGFGNDTITDYYLDASDREPIYLYIGSEGNLAGYSGADSGSDYVITVTHNGRTEGTITLSGITSSSTGIDLLDIRTRPVSSFGSLDALPPPLRLRGWFIESTPYFAAGRLYFKVQSNIVNTSASCFISGDKVPCPPLTLVSLKASGEVQVDAILTRSGERTFTASMLAVSNGHLYPPAGASGGNGTVRLDWHEPDERSGSVGNINGYIVQLRKWDPTANSNAGDWGAWGTMSTGSYAEKVVSDRTHTFTGLDAGDYQARVRARSDGDDGDPMTTDSAILGFTSYFIDITVAAANTNPPGQPTNVSVTPGAGKLSVIWYPPNPDLDSVIHGYTVRHKASGAPDSDYVEQTIYPMSANYGCSGDTVIRNNGHSWKYAVCPYLEIEGLTSGTEYDVQIRSHNANGESAWLSAGTHRPN